MSKIIHLVQGSGEWHRHRASHFNASEAAAMLGVSPYMTRSELLRQKATGDTPEIDEATQHRFNKGHEYEAIARPWAEEIIGETLYPVVLADEIHGLFLSTSMDGLTMMEDTAFEHKTLNRGLAESLDAGVIPDEYKPQMEQGLMISGATKCLFMASAGDRETMRHAWYESDPVVRSKVLDGWRQFADDLANYQYVEAKPEPVGRAPDALPALHVEVTGMVTASNLAEFKTQALAVLGSIKTDLQKDDDFASAAETVKWCTDVESRLEAAKQHALSQTTSIDELFRTIDDVKGETRAKRLELDRLVKARKQEIRNEILLDTKKALAAHVAKINATLGGKVHLPEISADFAGAMKGKKTVTSLRDAAETELARAKVDAGQVADRILANVAALNELAADYQFLFADLQSIVTKAGEDFIALVKMRIAEHKTTAQQTQAKEQHIDDAPVVTADTPTQAQCQREETSAPCLPYAECDGPGRIRILLRSADDRLTVKEAETLRAMLGAAIMMARAAA